jgi:NAD+ kinase
MLGVNLGTKGFMTSLEQENILLIVEAAKGHYQISKRMMLDVTLIRGEQEICRDSALNDAVIHGYGECVSITAWCNGQRMTGFTGDGVILSTPTGSTGYSMSAGGPIVEPDAENMILSPICAHVMGSRTFVLDPNREIIIRTGISHGRKAYLSVDGNSVYDLENGDILRVRRSTHYALMADMGLKSFYETAFEKLR